MPFPYQEQHVVPLAALDARSRAYVELCGEQKRARLRAARVRAPWARQFEGRPMEFIAAVMGDEWWGPSWGAWRCFVRVLFGLPLTDEDRDIYRECTGLDPDNYEPRRRREAWMPIGRRGGKSYMESLIGAHLATCYDWRPHLRPGQFGHVSIISDSREHSGEIMDYLTGIFQHAELAKMVQRDLTESLELNNQVAIEVVTASKRAVRARTVIAALCDEIAHWRYEDDSANADVEIMRGLRPSMATIPQSMLLGASSRYARRGVLWDAYERYFGKDAGPLVWSADTLTMHPDNAQLREDVAREYEEDPVSAEAEFGLGWRSDVSSFIPIEILRASVSEGVVEIPPVPRGVAYRAFVDPAGGSGPDSMTLAIAHLEDATTVVLDAVREVRSFPFSPPNVVAEFCELLRSYNVVEVTGDRWGGLWVQDHFAACGIKYVLSERSKSEIYLAWLPLLNAGRSRLLDLPRLVAQASQLERRTRSGARDGVDHPPRGHDDVANVVAGVQVMCADGSESIWSRPWGAGDQRPANAVGGSALGYASLVQARRRLR